MCKLIVATLALSAATLLMPATASATGGLDCSIDDKNVEMIFDSLFSYSDNGPLFQIRGTFEARNSIVFKALKKFDIQASDLKQQWTRDKQVKLMFYRETEGDGVPFASVKLVIEARQPEDEDFAYEGTYQLDIQPAVVEGGANEIVKLKGTVGCSAG